MPRKGKGSKRQRSRALTTSRRLTDVTERIQAVLLELIEKLGVTKVAFEEFASVAQPVERWPEESGVGGSNPPRSTSFGGRVGQLKIKGTLCGTEH